MTDQHSHARERAASAAQYVLLGGFAAVAAGISAQGLTGFARSDMELTGPWPYLLFLALDGAAGVCAVLLVLAARIRRAERRAHRALTRAGFAEPAIAAEVLRQVQVLTMTMMLARLDYRTADAAQAAITNLIASPTLPTQGPENGTPMAPVNGHATRSHLRASAGSGDRDVELVAAATRIVAGARHDGGRLSQAALAAKVLRAARARPEAGVKGTDPAGAGGRRGQMRPARAAKAAAATREESSSLRRMLARCRGTVCSLKKGRRAMSGLLSPCATSLSTSSSRGVSTVTASGDTAASRSLTLLPIKRQSSARAPVKP